MQANCEPLSLEQQEANQKLLNDLHWEKFCWEHLWIYNMLSDAWQRPPTAIEVHNALQAFWEAKLMDVELTADFLFG